MHDTGAVISVRTRQQCVVVIWIVLYFTSTMSDAKLTTVTDTTSPPEKHHSMETVATRTSVTVHSNLHPSNNRLDSETEPRFQSAADDPHADPSSYMTSSSNVNKAHRTSAGVGESCVLDCHVRYPKAAGIYVQHIVTWRKQGIEAPIYLLFDGYPPRLDTSFQGRLRAVGPASIEISDVRLSDEGWYECTVLFMNRPEDQAENGTWIYLAVNVPPVLTDASPSLLIQREGDNVDMFCEARATPTPTLTWLKDGREMASSGHVTVAGRRVEMKGLGPGDAGLYTCRFSNSVGTISHHIKLVIQDDEWISSGNVYIMAPPRNTTAVEESRIRLSCHADGYPDNITYRWYRNGVDIQLVSSLTKARGQILSDGSLAIERVAKDDAGWYTCRPSNGVGSPSPEAEAYLNVTYLPRVRSMPERLYLPRNMMGRIECPVDSNPPLTVIVWSKDTKVIDFRMVRNVRMGKAGALLIDPVTAIDEGQYSCTPYSPLGAGQPSSVLHISVRDPPHFTLRPRSIYQRQPIQSVTMPCSADGDPKPTIIWRKADGSLPMSSKILHQHDGNLTIITLGKEDHGVYECVATNVVATIVTTALLIIELSSPHPPYNLTVVTSSTSAKLSWQPAYDGGFTHHYVVWYRRYSSAAQSAATGNKFEWRTISTLASDVTSLTIYLLRPDTQYEFAVLARNRVGDGLFSDVRAARTKAATLADPTSNSNSSLGRNTPTTSGRDLTVSDDAPVRDIDRPAQPLNLTVRSVRNNLLITWVEQVSQITSRDQRRNQPSLLHPDYYVIEYRTVGQWVPLAERVVGTTAYNWTTASRGATYQFRVIAYKTRHHHGQGLEQIPSLPSSIFAISTGDPMTDGGRRSDVLIGGVVGGAVSAVCGILVIISLIKICRHWQRHKKARQCETQLTITNDTEPDVHYDKSIDHDSSSEQPVYAQELQQDFNKLSQQNEQPASSVGNSGRHSVKETPI